MFSYLYLDFINLYISYGYVFNKKYLLSIILGLYYVFNLKFFITVFFSYDLLLNYNELNNNYLLKFNCKAFFFIAVIVLFGKYFR